MQEKLFLTFNSQIKYLWDKKKIECTGSENKKYLVKYGYLNLINAYKFHFKQGIDETKNHI